MKELILKNILMTRGRDLNLMSFLFVKYG